MQSFDPHVVIKPAPNGTCTTAYTTASPLLQRLPAQPRGNTQAVLLPSAVSGEGADVYIGIVHVEVQRRYENYFYKMQVSDVTRYSSGAGYRCAMLAGVHHEWYTGLFI
jgi:hypothetical protein